jgi:hypothetical protein
MRHYVIELRKVPSIGRAYVTIQSRHNSFSSALKARDRYRKQDEKNKEKTCVITYVIGRI